MKPPPSDIKLTPREVQLCALHFHDYIYSKMADVLNISPNTIRTQMQKLHLKIGAHSPSGVLLYAIRNGFKLDEATNQVYYKKVLVTYTKP